MRQFVLAVAGLRLDEGYALLGAECMEATRKGASHFSKILVVETQIIAAQQSSPGANSARGLADWKEGVEYDAIDAVVGPLQQIGIVLGKCVGRAHGHCPLLASGDFARKCGMLLSCSPEASVTFPASCEGQVASRSTIC